MLSVCDGHSSVHDPGLLPILLQVFRGALPLSLFLLI